jgi:hypothetical protein
MDEGALFKQYETDFCNKVATVRGKINSIPSLSGDQRRAKMVEIENDVKSAEVLVSGVVEASAARLASEKRAGRARTGCMRGMHASDSMQDAQRESSMHLHSSLQLECQP